MSYRGPGTSYKIRKTTKNNKTGDNYALTIPKYIAKKFEAVVFKLQISGNSIIFESGCKFSIKEMEEINNKGGMFSNAGNDVVFK